MKFQGVLLQAEKQKLKEAEYQRYLSVLIGWYEHVG
jgi:hypothetical protein